MGLLNNNLQQQKIQRKKQRKQTVDFTEPLKQTI